MGNPTRPVAMALAIALLATACAPTDDHGAVDASLDAAAIVDDGAAAAGPHDELGDDGCVAADRDPIVGHDPFCPAVAEWLATVEAGARYAELAKCSGLWERCAIGYSGGPNDEACFWCPFQSVSPHYDE